MKKWRGILSCALVMLLTACVVPFAGAADVKENENMLQFKQDGALKIMCFADPQDTNTPTKNMMNFYLDLLDSEQPDFVMMTGDQIKGYATRFKIGDTKQKVRDAIDAIVSPLVERNIPFAVTFGNHDDEFVKKEEQMAMYLEYPGCLAIDEGEALSGCGTYNLPILSADGKRTAFNLYVFDSHVKAEEENGGYGYVRQDQLEWYVNKSNELKAENGGEPVPSMAFQHVCVPEVYDMFTVVPEETAGAIRGHGIRSDKYYIADPAFIKSGALREGPCPSNVNGGQFEVTRQQGDVVAICFGHDHDNSFLGAYQGIDLVALPGVAFADYGQKDTRATRFITLHEDDPRGYETKVVSFIDFYGDTFRTNLHYYLYTTRVFGNLAKWTGIVVGVAAVGGIAFGVAHHVRKKKKTLA